MAIIWQTTTQSEKMKQVWAEKKAKALQEPIKETTKVEPVIKQPTDDKLSAILKRLEMLEAENQKLKANDPVSIARSKKEIFKWPRQYSFTLRGWKPVLSRTSKRKDSTRDLVFKNQFGQYESNHLLELKLWDGTTLDVDAELYNRDKKKTEPMPCKLLTNEEGDTSYIFNTSDYWEITILSSKFIN